MSVAKVAITLDQNLLMTLDRLVRQRVFPSRSRIIQQAVEEKVARIESNRLAKECEKLDRHFEQALAEEGMGEEMGSWPAY
jgi:metal-responsive CopG/Arc/MetJ family transcriptional regulator